MSGGRAVLGSGWPGRGGWVGVDVTKTNVESFEDKVGCGGGTFRAEVYILIGQK